MLKVILDTNIILASISKTSRSHIIIDFLFRGAYQIAINNDILLEYEEKLTEKFGFSVAESFIAALLQSPVVEKTTVAFNLFLIKADPDDNKFADVAFCSNANFIVSNDRHFNELKKYQFPLIKVISLSEFVNMLTEQ